MNRIRVSTLTASALTIIPAVAWAAGTTSLPTASVSGVTATSPVVRSTAAIVVSATVAATFDSNSGPTTVQTSCTSCAKGGNYCGTGNTSVKSQQVLTTTTVTIG